MPHPQPAGHLANPDRDRRADLLVLHPWWGLNGTIRALCDRLAAEGYLTFAPDLFGGRIATTIPEAEALSGQADETRVRSVIAEAAGFLSERADPRGGGLGVIGLSFGAWFALGLSLEAPERVRAVVTFYGSRVADYRRSRAAYLGHFAEADDFEPVSGVVGMESALRAAGRPVAFHTYPGTGHWFFEPDRADAYDEAAATLAWDRTVAFLRRELLT